MKRQKLLSMHYKAIKKQGKDISLLDKNEALRMIDFLGGVMYALNGDMKRINKTTFEFSVKR